MVQNLGQAELATDEEGKKHIETITFKGTVLVRGGASKAMVSYSVTLDGKRNRL